MPGSVRRSDDLLAAIARRSVQLVVGVLLASSPLSAQRPAPELTAREAANVERWIERRGGCLGCHRIGERGGAIGPALDGVRERWSFDALVALLRDPEAAMPGTRMPAQRMTARHRRDLAAWLLSRPAGPTSPSGVTPRPPPPLPDPRTEDGALLYAHHCAACHGEAGGGDGWNAPLLPVPPAVHADPEAMSARTDDALHDGIAGGGYVLDGSATMPPFGELLSPEQIRALVRHIRTLCDCRGPAWAGGEDR